MNNPEIKFEKNEQKIEYNFNEGLNEVLQRIENLLYNQDYVVVTIHGSGINVGKTTLQGKLETELRNKEIKVLATGSDIGMLSRSMIPKLPLKSVVIFGAVASEGCPIPISDKDFVLGVWNKGLQDQAESIGLPLKNIDIKIAIYSPDKPFFVGEGEEISVDIIIKNEFAIDKKKKYDK